MEFDLSGAGGISTESIGATPRLADSVAALLRSDMEIPGASKDSLPRVINAQHPILASVVQQHHAICVAAHLNTEPHSIRTEAV